jgi:glyoxylase-like metal-dependent hydrolase (beta-lactamase superfamily II)
MTMNRRAFLASSIAATAVPSIGMLASSPAGARAAPLPAPPGLARFRVGDVAVTAISDGYIDMSLQLFPKTPAAEGRAAVAASPQARPLRGHVNAFLVETDGKRVLIDTGGVAAAIPTLGRFGANLQAAGVAPETIDAVIMTHLHVDHVGGLFGPNGTAAFPNAELIMSGEEYAFWTSPSLLANAQAEFRPLVQAARGALAPYASRTTRVSGEKEVVKGLTLTPAHGHTPGHSAVRLASAGQQLLFWGDIIHAPALQFARPGWSIAFDTDQDAAAATRARYLDMVSSDRLAVMGAHLPFPGHGHVRRAHGAYSYEPAFHDYDA